MTTMAGNPTVAQRLVPRPEQVTSVLNMQRSSSWVTTRGNVAFGSNVFAAAYGVRQWFAAS